MKKIFRLFGLLMVAGLLNFTQPVVAQPTTEVTENARGMDDDDMDDDDGEEGLWGLAGLLGLLGLLGLRRNRADGTVVRRDNV